MYNHILSNLNYEKIINKMIIKESPEGRVICENKKKLLTAPGEKVLDICKQERKEHWIGRGAGRR